MTNLGYSVEVGTNIEIPGKFATIDGTVWSLCGKVHREDGPAVEEIDGTLRWYISGRPHRCDGPALERPDGFKAWQIHGKYHREDGPAVELSGGTKMWYLGGMRHREDGPAAEYANGAKEWYLDNIEYSKKDWTKELKRRNKPVQLTVAEICDRLGLDNIEIIEG